jgi:hypothetical protein
VSLFLIFIYLSEHGLAFRDGSKMERLSNNQSSHDLVPVILNLSIALPFEWVQPVLLERGAR